jgi:hypothetical protein
MRLAGFDANGSPLGRCRAVIFAVMLGTRRHVEQLDRSILEDFTMSMTQGLFALGSNLYAAWKGEVGDDRLFYAAYDGSNWKSESLHIPGNSSVGPSLAATGPSTLYAAWKGENGDSDQRLFYAVFDGSAWQPQIQIQGVASSVGPALGVLNGVLYAAWKGEEGDNQIYWSYLNGSTWEPQQPIAGANSLVGPSLAEFGGNLYAGYRGAIKDEGLHFMMYNGSIWEDAPSIPGNPGSSVGPSLAQYGGSLYAAWKGIDDDQGIYYASLSGGVWTGQTQIPNIGSSVGPALAQFGPKLYAMWKGEGNDQSLYYAIFDGSWSGQNTLPGNTGQDSVPVPESGLTDNRNYWIYSNCNPITGLTVTIEVTQDLVYESTTKGGGKGFSFQLNAFSQVAANIIVGWQQFIYNVDTSNSPAATNFHGQFETWPGQPTINGISPGKSDLINSVHFPTVNGKKPGEVATLNTNGVIGVPAGYQLSISLRTDNNSNVNSATFTVTDPNSNNGKPYSTTISPLGLQRDPSLPQALQGTIQKTDFAPILAFQLVLVGPDETHVQLSSGAANISYTTTSATNLLSAVNAAPSCIRNVTTGETANSVYSTISAGSGSTLTQMFWVGN